MRRCHDSGCQREAGHGGPHRSRWWNAQTTTEEIEEWGGDVVPLTDDEIRGLHRIAKELGDPQVMTLCEIALGDIGITRDIARAALQGAKP